MQDLWEKGFRPRNIIDEKSALTATKAHLEDMRRLVFEETQHTVRLADRNVRTDIEDL